MQLFASLASFASPGLLVSLLLAGATGTPASGAPPGPSLGPFPGIKGRACPQKDEGESAMRAARDAVQDGSYDRALGHLERALASPSMREEATLLMAEVAKAQRDKDLVVRAARLWLEANVGPSGRLESRPPKGAFLIPGTDEDAAKVLMPVALAKASAIESIIGFAKKRESQGARSPEQLLTAAWIRRVGLDLAQSMPGLVDSATPMLRPYVGVPSGAHSAVLKAVERVGSKALSDGKPGLAIRAGRILHGLGVQADFKDLLGPRPSGMAKWRAKGAKMMASGRSALQAAYERPWTVEELEWLATEEGETFTRERSNFASPGVAISPDGLYRIESDCGHATLLAAARTIELHHRRLAALFGSDPFAGGGDGKVRQGLVRIVPDPSGLEAEGAPFFWAGGFQSGDTTVVRHTSGTVEGLGRLLTHELTHRFDGALHIGIPSWLAEGRAVWTGAAYGDIEDTSFTPDFCNWGSMQTAAGHAATKQLELLVSGTPSDYRQNYSVGNALYVFLSTWFPGDSESFTGGSPIFAVRLKGYEDSGQHATGPKGRFAEFQEAFCDGAEGRPASFEEFAALFRDFVYGFDSFKPSMTAKRYGRTSGGGTSTWIYDEPTWTWDWVRAEPHFGQTQARRAGELLAEYGRADDAIRAFVWARAVDGYDARTAWGLANLLEPRAPKSGPSNEALFAVLSELGGDPFGALGGDKIGASGNPFPTNVPGARELLNAELKAAATLAELGAPGAAARAVREARRFSRFAGLEEPPLPEGAVARPADREAPAHAFDALSGWMDESLTRVDDRRPKELFYLEKDGGLHLGRRKPRAGSGRIDRSGGGKSFVRSDRWMLPGQYRIRTQIRFTTGYNTAVAVIGWQARDRNVRLQLFAGSYLYAIGKEDEEPKFETVNWRFDGMRTRDAGLPGSARAGGITLPAPSTAVTLELVVDGARVSAWIAGQYAGSYHVVDGSPIEGYVGFGTLRGAVRVAPPIVRREDGDRSGMLDMDLGVGPSFDQLENVTIRLPGGESPPTNGMLMLWVPAYAKADPEKGKKATVAAAIGRTRRAARQLLQRMARNEAVQPLVMVLPKRFGKDLDADALLAELESFRVEGQPAPRVILHSVDAGEISPIDDGRRWLMFVDGFGIARATRPWSGPTAIDDGPLEHWLTVFRDHGRPADRALPKVVRPEEKAEEKADGKADDD